MANAKGADEQKLYHLLVHDAGLGAFWLHLEMNGEATLKKLDDYLRTIWLDCCGHLSHFAIGDGWRGSKVGMSRKAGQLFSPGLELTHLYDYGTTSETVVKVVGMRAGRPLTKHPIALMARNQIPAAPCKECGEQAKFLCLECLYEEDESGLLCAKHAEDHPHHNYGEPLPFVNSPRVGMCGDVSPAEPPY
jgi:hypothetical protein